MATNFIQPGKTITLTAPYARASGEGAQVGSIFGVALATVANAADGDFALTGVWDLAKTSTQAWTQGQKIYWDNSNKRCDSDSTLGLLIGVASEAAANPSSTGKVRLNGVAHPSAEGPQGAIVSLTDNSGDSGTHDDTIADGVTVGAALTDNSGGGPVDTTLEDCNDAVTGVDGTANNAASKADVDTRLVSIANNFADLAARVNTLRTDSLTHNQNVSDLTQKVLEILTALRNYGVIVP